MNGGEDYELLFTVPVSDYEKIQVCLFVSVIGHISPADEGLHLVVRDGSLVKIEAQGWNAYP